MNSANQVDQQIQVMKNDGWTNQMVAWETAKLCVGWAYVFGARGEYCTPANRRKYYASKGDEHPTIKSACKNFDGSGSCSGCKWYPGGAKTRFFDCRGFTYWVLKAVYGWELMGAGATSQWSNGSNWKAKGEIGTMPKDTLCCLFVKKGNTMSHTGFGYNNETCECSSGVQYFSKRNKKWTHWGVPACIEGAVPTPTPTPDPEPTPTPVTEPTLRRGNKGEAVRRMQTLLFDLGYSFGSYGVDGDFGIATAAALKQFQKDHGLQPDGICGPQTWAALKEAKEKPKEQFYTVSIPHLDKTQAEAIRNNYPGSTITEE